MSRAAKPEPISEDLLLAVYHSLLRYWIKQGVSKEEAEDLAQEGILKCLRTCEKWKRKASLKTFLVAVAKNAGREAGVPFDEVVIGILRGRRYVTTNSKPICTVSSAASTEA
jgi:hypothetical protein